MGTATTGSLRASAPALELYTLAGGLRVSPKSAPVAAGELGWASPHPMNPQWPQESSWQWRLGLAPACGPFPGPPPQQSPPVAARARAFLRHPPPLPSTLLGGTGHPQSFWGGGRGWQLGLALDGVGLARGAAEGSPFIATRVGISCPPGVPRLAPEMCSPPSPTARSCRDHVPSQGPQPGQAGCRMGTSPRPRS